MNNAQQRHSLLNTRWCYLCCHISDSRNYSRTYWATVQMFTIYFILYPTFLLTLSITFKFHKYSLSLSSHYSAIKLLRVLCSINADNLIFVNGIFQFSINAASFHWLFSAIAHCTCSWDVDDRTSIEHTKNVR